MRRFVVVWAAVLLALPALAQIPVPLPPEQCGVVDEAPHGLDFDPRGYRIPNQRIGDRWYPGSFCSAYTYGGGWDETMQLHLGEGAEEYRKLIEQAVAVWNEAIKRKDGKPAIEIVEARPVRFSVPAASPGDFPNPELEDYRNDGENVIYFLPYGYEGENPSGGLAWYRKNHREMLEADLFVNTTHEERWPEDTLVLTNKLIHLDESYGAYSLHSRTFNVILHELGHAMGLNHIPVSGNIMGRDFGAGGIDQWTASLALELYFGSSAFFPYSNPFVRLHEDMFPYMRIPEWDTENLALAAFFTVHAKLGEQEKVALTCIYEPY